ncbi:C4-dicarboxylate transport sensor protein [Actibacterium atlanticum]|uniref:C4-dicarboxylate transport sensor protein DctB n=1 Tax=Actibacterium atlanticum TaxID=1461693 RepID=A0A058ZR05_9RHOB|nr:ATP-binding protein [Actibacterium atlanticum]KCV83241.1 C4-dicarboxylate transport sensor protein [Actibacterium atlanticum]
MTRFAATATMFLMLALAIAGGTWWFGYRAALGQLAARGQSNLSLAADRLLGELQQYRELAVLMANRPDIVAALEGRIPLSEIEPVLLSTGDMTGTLELRLVGADGTVLASSGAKPYGTRRDNPAYKRAMQGALGSHHARIDTIAGRAITFSAPVFGSFPGPIGVLEVDVNVWAVEAEWLADPQAVYFTDALGVIFISNRAELLFNTTQAVSDGVGLRQHGYDLGPMRALPVASTARHAGLDVWMLNAGPYLPAGALHLVQYLPVIDMTGELLLDIAPAQRIATLQAAVAAALSLIVGSTLLLLLQRRQALSERLMLEEHANAQLERRVAKRTAELSATNLALRREVAEREEAEAALKQAQADLVQAGKLSALGQMSAGISHELNQPLMAIQSFAENGQKFMTRGNADKAGDNLGRIAQMAARMARIIKNLRAFARNESEPMGKIDLVAVIDQAVELTETRLRNEQVALSWHPPDDPVFALGGEVRLSQVFVNLINNAADAMTGLSDKRIEIAVQAGPTLSVTVRDTGPGIDQPDKIFDPFYTTKEVGSSEGMGLGLSISYGLVQSFGGNIRGTNAPKGGAVFTVDLEYWHEEQVA